MRLYITVALASVLSTAAFGQTVYSDFGAGNSFSTNGWCVSGPNNLDCTTSATRYIAAPFTPNATQTLSTITLALAYISGTNGAVINLTSNGSGGIPGTVIESWSISNLPAGASPCLSLRSYPDSTLHSRPGTHTGSRCRGWLQTPWLSGIQTIWASRADCKTSTKPDGSRSEAKPCQRLPSMKPAI
jgi:hypothetical protein